MKSRHLGEGPGGVLRLRGQQRGEVSLRRKRKADGRMGSSVWDEAPFLGRPVSPVDILGCCGVLLRWLCAGTEIGCLHHHREVRKLNPGHGLELGLPRGVGELRGALIIVGGLEGVPQ